MSWFGFAEKILEQAKQGPYPLKVKSIKSISSNDFKSAAKRPKYSAMSNSLLFDNFPFLSKHSNPGKF